MCDPSRRDRVLKRPRNRLLAHKLVEVARPIATGEDGVAGGRLRLVGHLYPMDFRVTGGDEKGTARTPEARTTTLMAAAVKP